MIFVHGSIRVSLGSRGEVASPFLFCRLSEVVLVVLFMSRGSALIALEAKGRLGPWAWLGALHDGHAQSINL